ncbi:protein zwilch homolog isoform X2 [Hippocampus zosterae]|uniref:protein zwilch homolog isoform X2 n=1 Tax=Hippocampus zosterae TaxID=109293 RepID=UPI00223DF511|nr:protein zwilch homolog isoform X2 [Hippocampus zosterae]
MATKVLSSVKEFFNTLRNLQEDESNHCYTYEDEIQILKKAGDRIAALNLLDYEDQEVFICEKALPKLKDSDDESTLATSICTDDNLLTALQIELTPQPLTITKARQMLSWYTLSQNVNVHAVDDPTLRPLWVRCDMSDPARTTWFGAEGVCVANKMSGVKLYSVTCKGPVNKSALITLDELKREHKKRHQPSTMAIKGSAQFNVFGSIVVEGTKIESQSSVTVDFKWSHVESVLETPPLSSTATLNIKVATGDMRSPMFEMFRELQFLQVLADGLRTGGVEWLDPLESKSAVDLTTEYLEELQRLTMSQQAQGSKPPQKDPETDPALFHSFLVRGDLDFVEQLWVRLRKSVVCYQDVKDSLKLVIEALTYGYIKPWIHRDNSSSLCKLILQSYHQKIEHVSLTGLTPIQMLLEMGLDKMRKDYFNYLVGEELTTPNNLSYYLNTEVDLQEQVIRLRKLHHLLEVVVTCRTFLDLPYDRLFLLTQLCLQHYKTSPYNEAHEFQLQIKPALITNFYQSEHPVVWGVEVSSGQGPHMVKTSLQVSDRPLVDHVNFETVGDDSTEPVCFSTLVCCSLVNFA